MKVFLGPIDDVTRVKCWTPSCFFSSSVDVCTTRGHCAKRSESIFIWRDNRWHLLTQRRLTLPDGSSMRKWSNATGFLFLPVSLTSAVPRCHFPLAPSSLLRFVISWYVTIWLISFLLRFSVCFHITHALSRSGTYRGPSWLPQSFHFSPSPSVHCSLQAFLPSVWVETGLCL